jgi:hypothetical protein
MFIFFEKIFYFMTEIYSGEYEIKYDQRRMLFFRIPRSVSLKDSFCSKSPLNAVNDSIERGICYGLNRWVSGVTEVVRSKDSTINVVSPVGDVDVRVRKLCGSVDLDLKALLGEALVRNEGHYLLGFFMAYSVSDAISLDEDSILIKLSPYFRSMYRSNWKK